MMVNISDHQCCLKDGHVLFPLVEGRLDTMIEVYTVIADRDGVDRVVVDATFC